MHLWPQEGSLSLNCIGLRAGPKSDGIKKLNLVLVRPAANLAKNLHKLLINQSVPLTVKSEKPQGNVE